MKRSMTTAVLLGLAGTMMAAVSAVAQTAAPQGNARNGEKLYKDVGCYQCHNYQGQGGGAGPRIVPLIPLTGFSAYLRAPKAQMPPYTAKVLSDAQMADIYAYLQAIPKGPSAKSIPLLNEK